MEIIYFSSIILSILFLLFGKNFKDKYGIFRISLFVLILIFMVNANDKYIDLVNYKIYYNNIAKGKAFSSSDFGYYLLQKLFLKFGFDFYQFKLTILLISLFLIFKVARKYINNFSFFVLVYMSYYIFLDAEQLRNFLAFSIVMYGLTFLISNKRNIFKFFVLIFIASSIHITAIVYLLFLIVLQNDAFKNLSKKVIILYVFVAVIILKISNSYVGLFDIINKFVNEGTTKKLNSYINNTANLGFLFPSIIYIIYYFIINKIIVLQQKNIENEKENFGYKYAISKENVLCIKKYSLESNLLGKNIVTINIVGLLLLPLSTINLTFYRLFRNITLIGVIYMASMYNSINQKNKKVLILLSAFLVLILWRIWDFSIYEKWDEFQKCYFG